MLNHARVVLEHIILTTIGDGFLNLFQANKRPCQCLCRVKCSHLLNLYIGIWFIYLYKREVNCDQEIKELKNLFSYV